MTQQEIALKCASASTKCGKNKCPFAYMCKGDYDTCVMKEIAMYLRADLAEIDTLNLAIEALRAMFVSVQKYTMDLEKINKRYRDMIIAFGKGYKPKKPGSRKRIPKKFKEGKMDPIEMDGDERFAYEPDEKPEPAPPLVVI